MKKTLTVVRYALVSLFSFLFIGSAMAEKMYNNPLDGKANVPAGTYGDITVSGNGYMATAFSTQTNITGGEGSYRSVIYDGTWVNTHTVSGWFNVTLPTDNSQKTIYFALNENGGNHTGYRLAVDKDGYLYVGKTGNRDGTSWQDNAYKKTAAAAIQNNTWAYITVALSVSNKAATPSVFVNGNVATMDSGTFAVNLNGHYCNQFLIGAGVSAAGLYVDTTALSDVATIKSLATDANYVVPYVPAVEATITAAAVKVSDINNAPEFTSCGATDKVVVKLTAAKTLEFDTTLKFAGVDIVYDGALKLLANAVPADFAKFDLSNITGLVSHEWYKFSGKKVIAINFGSSETDGSEGANDISQALDIDAYGKMWNNVGNGASGSDVSVNVYDSATQANDGTATLSWSSNNEWRNAGVTDVPFLKGYLDDGGNNGSVTITGIPFAYYDVVVYSCGDGNNNKPVTVNNVTYTCGADGIAVAGTSSWGDRTLKTAAWGHNAMLVTKQTGSTATVHGAAGSGRGPISAVMIIETTATTKNVDCGSAYNISSAKSYTEDIVNLNFADAGGVLTLDEAPAREFNVVSKGAVSVKFGNGVGVSAIAKLNVSQAEGGIKYIITDGTIPATAPAAGVTYRWEGETALTAIPFGQDQVAGTLEIACPLNVDATAKIEVFRDKNIVFDGNFALSASAFVCGNKVGSGDSRPSQTITQNAGAITLTKEYDGTVTTSDMPLLFAHWPSDVVYNLVGGSITSESGNVMFGRDGTIAMTVGGDDNKTATFKARGLFQNGRDNDSSLTISKNGAVLVGVGGVSFATSKKIVLNGGTLGAYDNATITTTLNLEVTADSMIDVAEGKTLTLAAPLSGSANITKTGLGKLVITGSRANYMGTITIAEGAYDIGGVRDFSTIGQITTSGTGFLSATAIAADDGEVKITNVPAGTTLVIYDIDGVTPLQTTVVGTTVTATSSIATDGEACLYDWTFKEDSLTSVGQIKATMTWDTGYKDGQDYASERILESEDFVYGKALNTKATPYSDFVINYPTEWTCVVAGIVPNNENAALIAFGTRGGGSIAILKGATDTEVKIVRTIGDSAYVPLATMQVANALTTSHTYAFVKTADAITVYLDGNLWNTTPISNVSFGDRIQVGSIHGGKGSTNIESSKDATNDTAIQAVRIFEGALGPNALKQLADEFPYNSPNGTFAREFAEGEGAWTLTDSWTDTKTQETAELPTEGSTLNISAAGAAEITVDLTAETEYEAMTFSGAAMTFKAGDASAVNIGLTTVATPIEIEYGSISIANGPFVVSGNGSVAFDYSAAPIDNFKGFGFVALTGTTGELADGKVTCTLPDKTLPGRVVTFGYSTEHKAYGVTTAADRSATTLYLTADTTLGDDTLFALTDGGDAVTPRMFAEDVIVVPSGKTLTLPTAALAIPLGEIDGAGKVVLGAQSAITLADTWTGTVKFLDCAINNDPTLDTFGNANSKIEIENCTGYQATRTLPCVILTGEGFAATDGHSNNTVTFTKLEGSGKLTVNHTSSETWKLLDIADYDGVITVGGGMSVSIGDATRSAGGAIDFADGVTVKAGLGWTATSATFGDTLTVKGALGDTLVSGLAVAPASVPAVMLVGEEGDYTLAYADGKLTVVNASVAVAIPTIAGTTVVVYAGEDELTPDPDGNVAVPYGADIFVTYIVEDGKVFKDGSYMVELEYEDVTTENIPNVQADIDDLEVIDDVVPEASAEKLDPIPEGMATAATFAVTEAGSENYADFTATFTITANKDVAQDAIVLAGQFNATNLEDPEGVNNNYDGEWIDMPLTSGLTAGEPYTVVSQPWSFVTEFVKTFNCGLKNVGLTEDTSFTVTLTVYKEEFAVLEKEITLDVVAKKLPTADVTAVTVDGLDKAAMYELKDMGVGYEDWYADFTITLNKDVGAGQISLGGAYGKYGLTSFLAPEFKADVPQKVMALYGDVKVTVAELDTIKRFVCGIKNNTFTENIDVTVQLVIYNDETTITIGNAFKTTVDAIKAVEPVDPEVPQTYDTPEKAEAAAAAINANKEAYINAPDGIVKADYVKLFEAVVSGTTVTVQLTTSAETEIKEDLAKPEGEATILEPVEGKATIAAKPGLFYGIAAEDSLDKMATAKGQNWVMATGDTVEVEVPAVTDAEGNKAKTAFFRPTCTAKVPAAE